jgi:hypothetical protein
MYIGRTQAQFTLPDFQEKFFRVFFLKIANDICCSVRRVIINNQYMKILF